MGIVVKPQKAFRICHGYKVDDELILWSEGVVGALDDMQERKCRTIIVENAKGGPVSVHSVDEALKLRTVNVPKEKMGQVVAIKRCAGLLDVAEDIGYITNVSDVYAFTDYCMAKLGYNGVKRHPREDIKEFIDNALAKG